jgi:hypothetical protein
VDVPIDYLIDMKRRLLVAPPVLPELSVVVELPVPDDLVVVELELGGKPPPYCAEALVPVPDKSFLLVEARSRAGEELKEGPVDRSVPGQSARRPPRESLRIDRPELWRGC